MERQVNTKPWLMAVCYPDRTDFNRLVNRLFGPGVGRRGVKKVFHSKKLYYEK